MTQRSPGTVLLLSIITLGIYQLYWTIATKDEMNGSGASVPSAWLLLVPIVNVYWFWKWCEGVQAVTKSDASTVGTFFLMALLGPIGAMIVQGKLNGAASGSARLVAA